MGECLSLYELREALSSLPGTLEDTYARILSNIPEKRSQQALKILQWLVYSARPLRIKEVAEVIIVDIKGDPQVDILKRLLEPQDILKICSSLVTTTMEETKSPHGTVRLSHFSVKEYLVSERIQTGPDRARPYSIREIHANVFIAEVCLAYLLQFDKPNSLTLQTIEEFPLAGYAARYWTEHARLAGKDTSAIHLLIMELFLIKKDAYVNWIRLFDPDDPWSGPNITGRSSSSIASPLYYTSSAGLIGSVRLLLKKGADANVQGGYYSRALHAASQKGYEEVVRLLLEKAPT